MFQAGLGVVPAYRRSAGWNGGSGATQAPRHAPEPFFGLTKIELDLSGKTLA